VASAPECTLAGIGPYRAADAVHIITAPSHCTDYTILALHSVGIL